MAGNYVIIASGHKVMPPVGQINHAGCILYKVAGALSLLSLLHDVYFLYHMRLKKDDSRILCFIRKSWRARDYELGGDAAN
jgi:hypothetical protein